MAYVQLRDDGVKPRPGSTPEPTARSQERPLSGIVHPHLRAESPLRNSTTAADGTNPFRERPSASLVPLPTHARSSSYGDSTAAVFLQPPAHSSFTRPRSSSSASQTAQRPASLHELEQQWAASFAARRNLAAPAPLHDATDHTRARSGSGSGYSITGLGQGTALYDPYDVGQARMVGLERDLEQGGMEVDVEPYGPVEGHHAPHEDMEGGYEETLLNQPRYHEVDSPAAVYTRGPGDGPFYADYHDPFAGKSATPSLHTTADDVPLKPNAVCNDGAPDEVDEYRIEYAPTDSRHPYAWSTPRKWAILLLICSASVCVTATSSIQASTYNSLQSEFGVKRVVAVAGVSLYVLGFGVGALFLGPMSEFFGRRVIYLVSFALFTVFSIPIATAQNMGIFLFFRFITGLCGSGFLSVAGGSVSDLFPPGTTDIPVAAYTLSPLVGPVLGPLMGGFINQNVTWRATFYLIIAWSGCELLALYFFVPETFLPVALKNAAMDERIRTKDGRWYAPMERSGKKVSDVFPKALYVPVQLMLAEKMALAMDLWTSLILGIIYLFFNAIPFTFRTVYGFNLQVTGLAFLPMGIGMCLATASQLFWVKRIRNAAALTGGKAPPEARLPVGMAGAILAPAGLLWFSLTSFAKMPWIMPMLGTVLFGAASVYVFTSVFGFLVSTYPKYAASAMAGNTLLRCVWAAAFPLFADPLYRGLGPEGATGLLAGLTLLMAPIPFVLYRIGPRLRAASKYSS